MASIAFWYGKCLTSLRIVFTSSWSRSFELTVPILPSWHALMNSPTWLASMMTLCRVDAIPVDRVDSFHHLVDFLYRLICGVEESRVDSNLLVRVCNDVVLSLQYSVPVCCMWGPGHPFPFLWTVHCVFLLIVSFPLKHPPSSALVKWPFVYRSFRLLLHPVRR